MDRRFDMTKTLKDRLVEKGEELHEGLIQTYEVEGEDIISDKTGFSMGKKQLEEAVENMETESE